MVNKDDGICSRSIKAGHSGFQLEPIAPSHAAGLYPVLTERALYRYVEVPPPASEAALAARFERWQGGGSADGSERWLNFAVRLASGELVGYVQATVMVGQPERPAWVAYMLSERVWGRGLGRAATQMLMSHLAQHHGCTVFWACIEQDNARSIALVNALGFHRATAQELAPHELDATEVLYVRSAEPAGESPARSESA